MFQQVPNRNGRAACQDNWATFRIMRSSQFSAWTPEMCRLYLTCLQAAWSQGRNLVQEKYGWMMADTFPEEFAALQSALPPVEPERQRLAGEILDIQLPMTACLQQKYPLATRRGRPLYPDPAHPRTASVATYLRGELYTYSLQLLQAYLAFCSCCKPDSAVCPGRSWNTRSANMGSPIWMHLNITCGRYSPYDRAAVGPALL